MVWAYQAGDAGGEPAAVYVVTALLRHLVSGAPMFVEDDLFRLADCHHRDDARAVAAWLVPAPVGYVLELGLAGQRERRLGSLLGTGDCTITRPEHMRPRSPPCPNRA